MKNKVVNAILIVLVGAALASLAFFVRVGATADAVAVLKTDGMTCGGCATAVERALQASTGIASVDVDINGGWVVVGYDSKKNTPDVIAATIAGAGYRCKVAELMSVEQFRTMTGREPGKKVMSGGCGGCCNKNRY